VVSSRDRLSSLQWRPTAEVIRRFARLLEGVARSEQRESASARCCSREVDPAGIDERIDAPTAGFTHLPELAVRVRRSLARSGHRCGPHCGFFRRAALGVRSPGACRLGLAAFTTNFFAF